MNIWIMHALNIVESLYKWTLCMLCNSSFVYHNKLISDIYIYIYIQRECSTYMHISPLYIYIYTHNCMYACSNIHIFMHTRKSVLSFCKHRWIIAHVCIYIKTKIAWAQQRVSIIRCAIMQQIVCTQLYIYTHTHMLYTHRNMYIMLGRSADLEHVVYTCVWA